MRHCAYVNCKNNSRGHNRNLIKWIKVPQIPKCSNNAYLRDYQYEYIARRKLYRNEFLRRIGVPLTTKYKQLRM